MTPTGARRTRGITVALLGPDGAGKSTLTASLVDALSSEREVRAVYAGPYPKGARGVGPLAGSATALVLARLIWARARATWHRARGRYVVFDRHPYDAVVAPPTARRLTEVRRALIGWMGAPPDLILVLDAPAEVLYERKGEHDVIRLEEQRLRYLALAAANPRAVVLDTTVGATEVLRDALAEIAGARDRRGIS